MTEADVGAVLREAIMVMLKLGGPPLLVTLVVGVLVALLQAITQVNEAAMAYVPKVLALCAALALLGPFMFASLDQYTKSLFDRLVAIGARDAARAGGKEGRGLCPRTPTGEFPQRGPMLRKMGAEPLAFLAASQRP